MKPIVLLASALMATTTLSAPAFAGEGDWMFRLRGVSVTPDESAVIDPIGGSVDISSSVVPELDITYFVQDQWAVELILGVTPHDVSAIDTVAGDIDLGDVTLLPPTLTLQYHFNPDGDFRPYIGAGINYTYFFNEDLPGGSALSTIEYDQSFGFALQAGVDIPVNDTWFFNVDVKYVDIDTDVLIDGAISADVSIDPVLFGLGFGRRF